MIFILIYETKILKSEINSYIPKTNISNLKSVKVNNSDINYTLEDNTLLFLDYLNIGDILQLEFEALNQKIFTKSKYGSNALFKLYSDITKLKYNSKYNFHLETKDNNYDIEFKTKYNPYYSSIKDVRKDTGSLLELVNDDVIASLIFDNSLLVLNKLNEEFSTSNLVDTLDGLFDDGVPLYVKNYVRYKTDLDLCYSIYLSKTGKLGSFKKKLDGLDVSNEVKVSSLEDMLSRFKELFTLAENMLDSSASSLVLNFVKASSTSYPISNARLF